MLDTRIDEVYHLVMAQTYQIKDLPEPTWSRAQARAKAERQSMRAVILALLQLYADGRVSVTTDAVVTEPAGRV